MQDTRYSVSWAVKFLEVQSHVLRYWEEELKLPVGRNEMGHRYYTRYDIQVFLSIKELKKKGYSLKEIGGLTSLFYKTLTGGQQTAENMQENSGKSEAGKITPQFLEVVSRLVTERVKGQNLEEERYKRLDERIRICQQSRREVAAAAEKKHSGKKKRTFGMRKTK